MDAPRLRRAAAAIIPVLLMGTSPSALEASVDERPPAMITESTGAHLDVTDRVELITKLIARDSFANEFAYEVAVKNRGSEPLDGSSLIVVVDEVTNLAGKDALPQMEVVGQDGQTLEGKPYFRLGDRTSKPLFPYRTTDPVIIRIRNIPYTVVFTPVFRVRGRIAVVGRAATLTVNDLVQLLVRKGLLTYEDVSELIEEHGRAISGPLKTHDNHPTERGGHDAANGTQ